MTYSEQATAASQELDGELDEFLGALTALGGSAGNVRLREVLEWDDAAYEAAKAVLVDRGLILPGRGRGGSVALAGVDEEGGAEPSMAGKRPWILRRKSLAGWRPPVWRHSAGISRPLSLAASVSL